MIFKVLKIIKIEKIIQPMMPVGAWYLRVSPRMITCKEFNEFIFDYTQGLLTEEQSVLFKRHMRVCPMCRNFLKTYTASYSAVKDSLTPEVLDIPITPPQELLDAIGAVSDIKTK